MLDFTVPDMSCNHCVKAITEAIRKVDSHAELSFDLEHKKVAITTIAPEPTVVDALRDAGYPPA